MKGINKYGVVEDLDLAKRIIKEKFSGGPTSEDDLPEIIYDERNYD